MNPGEIYWLGLLVVVAIGAAVVALDLVAGRGWSAVPFFLWSALLWPLVAAALLFVLVCWLCEGSDTFSSSSEPGENP